jgi:DNA-binding MarR family transcriptional regulator
VTRHDDLLRLVLAAHTLTRLAALDTRNEAPAAQWRTLKLLREYGPQRVGDLAVLSRISQPGMTRLVGQLAEAGFLSREPDPADARVMMLALTPAGEDALDSWLAQLRGALAPHTETLDDAQWRAISVAADALSSVTAVGEVVR